ncbi:hypothetical protein [Streptomyces zagrosensis]|uniref:Uncharacterized protein n=1 Tax=Streptomyces zagrosensis TaxID=1042984 RepID=A0A7W9QCN6_9ACTN|nr:hypothetical protein [Streptomyces zagrosensis]MBB5937333.1 hypothetical protein [Streptomyces zagrosensis]
MTAVRVALLVWKPQNPDTPGDVSRGWPRVLQTRDSDTPWQAPSVILRPGELVVPAAERVAYVLGLVLPQHHRVLCVDQWPPAPEAPRGLTLVLDGGWLAGDDVRGDGDDIGPCSCGSQHQRRWVRADRTGSVALMTAVSAAVLKSPAFVVSPGTAAPQS